MVKRLLWPVLALALAAATFAACDPTTPPTPRTPVSHVVVVMQENHSADGYLGQLHNQGQPGYEAEPNTGNPNPLNPSGPKILPHHNDNLCETADLNHSWNGAHLELNGGAMDGFTAQNIDSATDPTGSRTMGYYDQRDLPYYYALYRTFATNDRYFSSVLGPTFPNRMFLYAGTSNGHISNDFIVSTVKSVFELMSENGVTWKIYGEQSPLTYGTALFSYVLWHQDGHVYGIDQYYTDVAAGNLPQVTFIDPSLFAFDNNKHDDEHPNANVQAGQKFEADVINALIASPEWSSSALFLTYDENGGYYDHVKPPAAPVPDGVAPNLGSGDQAGAFNQYGFRVPFVVVSPFAKAHYVSHVVADHTSILHFIEWNFKMPSLTNRDAKADLLQDEFDFTTPQMLHPPALPTATVTPC